MADSLAFEDLLVAARRGDDAAWGALYRAYAPKVLGYLRARSAPDPEDLLGEVMLQVVRDLGRFSGDERDFRSWIFTVAHHRMLDSVRARARRPVIEDLEPGVEPPGPPGDVEEEAMSGLAEGHIRAILETLSDDQQSVLMLRLFAGLTLGQIAEAMGKSLGAVKALQHRGIETLRTRLASSRDLLNLGVAMQEREQGEQERV